MSSSSSSSSSLDYKEPAWAVAPSCNWTLLEIKGGVEVASYELNESCTVLGRASLKIPLAHESCSRLHARIAFDQSGIPWLRDLSSSHGTTVNKRKLPVAAIGKVESNSNKSGTRGVVLYPGDVLQFGASTRMYCLEGPAEYERGAVRKQEDGVGGVGVPLEQKEALLQESEASLLQAPGNGDAAANDNKEDGILWGMKDTADDYNTVDSHDSHTTETTTNKPLDPSTIPEKHRKLFERLTAKQYKLQNVQLESERIRNKGSELSQGQEAQLHKNDERIQQWQQEIADMEQELHKKLHPEKAMKHKRKAHGVPQQNQEEDVDDYDFYDRTKDTHDALFQDGETQDSLIKKWKELLGDWKRISNTLLDSRQKVDRMEQRLEAADQNDEDSFFLNNDLSLAKDSLTKAEERKEEIAHNLQETEQLLRVVNERLEFDRETCFVGEPGEKSVPTTADTTAMDNDAAMMPPPVSASSPIAPPRTLSPAASMLPPPMKMPPPLALDRMSPPPAKRSRIMGPSAMPPPSMNGNGIAVDEMEMPPPQSSQRINRPRAPPIGTLSVLAAATKARAGKNQHSSSSHNKQKGEHNDTSNDARGFDPKKDVWKAPKDQDGSGMTKLNAKFAGRY